MTWIDWTVVAAYLAYVVYDGVKRSRSTDTVRGYFLANRTLPWWAVGLSVMATQMSAITLVGTTGQGYADGIRFVQFYFGLPFAMVILCVTVVPFFHRADVFTAYEYLEKRFDGKTRTLTSFFFLLSRGLSCGVIIAAPAVILSIILGWNLELTVLAIGAPTILYTMLGGVQAVTWTDVKQMALVFVGLGVCIYVILAGMPSDISLLDALMIAGSSDRLRAIDFSFDLNETYTFWSGLLGGLFLMLSYFGCDQSQVQRYLTARSEGEGKVALLMSAFVKIPMQFVILMIGALVFVFYQFHAPPVIFHPQADARLRNSTEAVQFAQLEGRYQQAAAELRKAAAELSRSGYASGPLLSYQLALEERERIRIQGLGLARRAEGHAFSDVNYIFPTFITQHMPVGIVGLMIAAIFAAA
ncbi:MAG TPA: sodium/solute symporter, partial [Acidobacteriota bacterium]|nr:sodium/solute symporter [Acidobacteriota bacterium]